MTNTQLKTIAIITMLIDHIGAVLYPEFIILRIIGRLAFPIFAFLLVEGFFHTSNIKKYLLRLGCLAIISEIPFDYAFFHKMVYMGHQNIFFTLFIGLLAIGLYDYYHKTQPIIAWGSLIGACYISVVLATDYNILGIMTVFIFYYYHKEKARALFSVGMLHVIYGLIGTGILSGSFHITGALQAFAATSMLLLWQYNGERGLNIKYLFYGFYPVHLLIIGVINKFN